MNFWSVIAIFGFIVLITRMAYLEGYMDANNDLVKRLEKIKNDDINNLKGE